MGEVQVLEYTKTCPVCGCLQKYKHKHSLKSAIENSTVCKTCSYTEEYKEKIRQSNLGQKRSEETKQNMYKVFEKNRGTGVYSNKGLKNPMYGLKEEKSPSYKRVHTDEEKERMRKPRSEEFKRKMRISTLKRIIRDGGGANYNRSACTFFERLNKEMKWKGVHAQNKGEYRIEELGYVVDYYEPTLNLVIEWDEEFHYLGDKLRQKDLERQDRIIQSLKCSFIRIRQKDFSTSSAAHPQMRELTIPLLEEFKKRIPMLFNDILVD